MDNSNIKLIRLQTGEDVIANLIMDNDNEIVTLENPMHVIFRRLPTGRVVMFMMPWLPLEIINHNAANIYVSDILTTMEPKESLVTYYGNVVEASLDATDDTTIRQTEGFDDEFLSIEEVDDDEYDDDIQLFNDINETKNRLH